MRAGAVYAKGAVCEILESIDWFPSAGVRFRRLRLDFLSRPTGVMKTKERR